MSVSHPFFPLSLPLVNHCVFSLNSLLVPLFSSQVSGCYVCSLVLSSHRALPASAAYVILVCPLFFLLRCVLCLVFCLWIMPVLLQAFFLGFWNVCTLIFPKKLMRDENRPMNKGRGEHRLQCTARKLTNESVGKETEKGRGR